MKVLLQIHVSVLLLICILGKAQQASARFVLNCNKTYEYQQNSLQKCCSRCPPGSYMMKECDETSDTLCQHCEDGKYMSSWNYKTVCSLCRPCSSFLIMTKNCSRTNKEQCDCPKEYHCTQKNGLGVCEVCMPNLIPTTPPSDELRFTPATPDYPGWVIVVIFVLVVVVITAIVVAIILYVRRNMAILEKLGCMPKIKKPLPESTELDGVSSPLTTPVFNTDPQFPIQESDPKQSAEYALNSPLRSHSAPLHQ